MFKKQPGWTISLVAHLAVVGIWVASNLFAPRPIVLRANAMLSGPNHLGKGDREAGVSQIPKVKTVVPMPVPPLPRAHMLIWWEDPRVPHHRTLRT